MKGRRLKRYFWLKRSKTFGFIEKITPNYISGWVADEYSSINEIRLFQDNMIIASSELGEFRKDVINKTKIKFCREFKIYLPDSLLKIDSKKKIKIIAFNASLTKKILIHPLKKISNFDFILRKIYLDNIYGIEFENFQKVKKDCFSLMMQSKRKLDSISLWIQQQNKEPIKLFSSEKFSDGNNTYKFKLDIDLKKLDIDSNVNDFYLTYDKEGFIEIEEINSEDFKIINPNENLNSSLDKSFDNIDDLNYDMEVLLRLKESLDLFENEQSKRMSQKKKKFFGLI